jgi:hypothetical protein
VGRYVKKGGHGGTRSGAGRKKPVTELEQLLIVERFRAEWEKECENAAATRPPKRLRANWSKLENVREPQRHMVIQLAEEDELPDNVAPVVRRAVQALKKNRTILDGRHRAHARARPYSRRQKLLRRIALEESQKQGVDISWQQLRHWYDNYEKLREKLFPREI